MYFITQLIAVLLPPATFLPLAVAFALLFLVALFSTDNGKTHIHIVSLLCVVSVALLLRSGYYIFKINPIKSLAGETHSIECTVREAIPLYTEHYKAVVRVEKIGDKDLYTTFLANLDDIELISNGDKLRLTVKFNDANGIKTLYNYSKNVFIEAEAVSEFELLGKSQDLVTSFKTLQNKLSNNITSVIQGENGYIAAAMSVGDKAKLSSLTKYQFR
ncbi:MAG: hypothetical protein RR573_09295, partial [Oscillospiraceae bacterium]